MERVKLRKIGNSLGVTLPKELVTRLAMREGDELNLVSDGKQITLSVSNPSLEKALKAHELAKQRYHELFRELAK